MAYLFSTFFWWLVVALIIGAIVGWITCKQTPRKEGLGWLGLGLIAFIIGLIVAVLKMVKGVNGLWLDTALLFFASYIIGCCIGCLFGRSAEVAAPVAAVATAAAPVMAPKPAPVPAGPATVRPYQWQAAKDASSVTLTGYVPSEDARGKIVANAKTTLAPATIIDKLQLASGAPVGLEGMAGTAFGHLAKLDKGIASLIDTKYTLTGVAGTQPNYDTVMGGVKALPAGYALAKVDIVAPPAPKPVPVAAPKPAPAPVKVAAPAPKPAPKIAGEDKVPGKRPAGLAGARGGKADDLKRIRGIGKQNEGRLHGLGIWHFDQIASWNAQECLWVGSYLAFPGRIEREEWVKQAKVLATGKETEFSKRVAKGEVATSKDDGLKGGKNIEVVKPMRKQGGTAPNKKK
jgi:predicted flap endonuclease-1-like 5' DNA nuclease/uncharacterized membrane protein YeaQ/YmgE (transglycosylase-associated protein family)